MNDEILLLFITVPNLAEGRDLAKKLLEQKLAACVNLIPQVESFYWWEGKIENNGETLLMIKTMKKEWEKLESFVRKNHSYSVPEIIGIPISERSEPYAQWIKDSVS
ncbi:MAG: divalent-cation tolerance protein CutA [Candidatus Eremiobacteraeota bacterium]|nr:divalent-cation tolerance protein CutA [Candidatus Eremiobacteraeota bacterium]MCL5055616.1 divalent-cation tolerance protein CutA [Bacillota bacterium]